MKEWNELLECIDAYIYLSDKEEIIIAHNENADQAKRVYQYALKQYDLKDNRKWEFDIALDCVRKMNFEDRKYVLEHPDTSEYHMGYAMYIRNTFIHPSILHSYFEADGVSTSVMEFIFSLLHPYYDFSNRVLCDFYDHWDYKKLYENYGQKYAEKFHEVVVNLKSKEAEKSAEIAIKELKEVIRQAEGIDGFKEIFRNTVQECLEATKEPYINRVWDEVCNKLYRRSVIYEREYHMAMCLKIIDLYYKVQSHGLGCSDSSSIDDCAIFIEEEIGMKREYALFFAECSVEALRPNH